MLWMMLIFAILQAQGGIYRQQLFDLQDAHAAPAPIARTATVGLDVDTQPRRPHRTGVD